MVDYTGVTAAQLFGPYGQVRWAGGTMPTSYAFTGQRALPGPRSRHLYKRRYDIGRGLNRYAYVGDNSIERIDPSGHTPLPDSQYHPLSDDQADAAWRDYQAQLDSTNSFFRCIDTFDCGGALADLTGWSSMQGDLHTLLDGNASTGDKAWALADFGFNLVMDASLLDGFGELGRAGELGTRAVEGAEERAATGAEGAASQRGFPDEVTHPYEPKGEVYGQLEQNSCVAASCRMVLADHGIEQPESWLRTAADVDFNTGTAVSNAASTLNNFGLPYIYEANLTLEGLQAATSGGRSAIVSLTLGPGSFHAVVVDGIEEGYALIRDPLFKGLGQHTR